MTLKTCNSCHVVLPLEEFHMNARRLDGHDHRCKNCANAYKRAHASTPRAKQNKATYRRNNKQRFSEWSAAWRARHPDKFRKVLRDHNLRHPDKRKGRNKFSNALRDGKIFRGPCAVCGLPNAEAHHSDYSKPLDVTWLCKLHHEELHTQADALAVLHLHLSNQITKETK
jgi:hypothetical protein